MKIRIISCLFILIVCSACQHATKKPIAQTKEDSKPTQFVILSINDVYRINGIDNGDTGGLARVRALRKKLTEKYEHVLMLHAGDFLHPSFISKQDDGRAMIQSLNMMDGAPEKFDENMLVTWGNHEFDKGRMRHVPLMNELLQFSEFTWLGSNIKWQPNTIEADNNLDQKIYQFGDIKVGVFSFTTDIVHPEYIASFDDYTSTAEQFVPQLRAAGADFVIGLTHHWLQDDIAMMNLAAEYRPDIILGGHEHYVQMEQINGRWVLKADADAASAVVAEVTYKDNEFMVQPQIISLNKSFPKDAATNMLTNQLSNLNDINYCKERKLGTACLKRKLGTTQVNLIAEETEIRRFETNLGNLLADITLEKFAACDADVALLNSGSVRLNQNIPAGAEITTKHLEEMFPYSSDLRLIEFDRNTLAEVLTHSVSSWTANGHWLQVAGLAFIHNPNDSSVEHIHLKGEICEQNHPKSTIRAVVPNYLISDKTDQDGYTMINAGMEVKCDANGAEVKKLFTEHLKQQQTGLNVSRDHRICNTNRDQCH